MTTAAFVPSPRNDRLGANLACIFSMLVWAVGFPLGDELLKTLPALTVTLLRMSLAALFLIPVWLVADGARRVRQAAWGRGLWVGAVGFGLGSYLLIFAQSRTDGVTVAVIFATMPVVGIALECLLDRRRLSWQIVAGLLLSVMGGVAVYAARMGHINMGLGALAALVSIVVYCWGSRASVTALPGHSAIARTALTIIGAALGLIAAQVAWSALSGEPVAWTRIGVREWNYLAVYGIGSLALSQLLFLIGVAGLGIGIASMHINIAPFYVMLFALALGGGWNWGQGVGAAVVAAGVIIAQGRRRGLKPGTVRA